MPPVALLGAAFLFGSVASILRAAPPAAAADLHEAVLYNFCSRSNCADGANPRARLSIDGAGNLFGTTSGGGKGGGSVFELHFDPAKGRWATTILYRFCSQRGCADGPGSLASLLDVAGNLYGTTANGGAFDSGTAFALHYDAAAKKWTETVLYSFCAADGCADGYGPKTPLVADAAGNLYGTALAGGDAGVGVVFELHYDPAAKSWSETVLHSFCSEKNCADGASPEAGLTIDAAGRLFGTSYFGGAHSAGTVFELHHDVATGRWPETILHSFCPRCSEGAAPAADLLLDGRGDLFGTTTLGGKRNGGTAFELRFDAATRNWTFATLRQFAYFRLSGGLYSTNEVTADASGTLYGTRTVGGTGKAGTAFALSRNAANQSWKMTLLYEFCAVAGCADGSQPGAGLTLDAAGKIYGTTVFGGANNAGTVFELKP